MPFTAKQKAILMKAQSQVARHQKGKMPRVESMENLGGGTAQKRKCTAWNWKGCIKYN